MCVHVHALCVMCMYKRVVSRMAVSDLLRGAACSQEDKSLYEAAAYFALQSVPLGERAGERASDALFAAMLRAAPTSGGGCVGGEGKEGSEERRMGSHTYVGGRETFWQLCHEVAGPCDTHTLDSFVCQLQHFQVQSCALLSSSLRVGAYGDGMLRGGEEVERFLAQGYKRFWSAQIGQFAAQVSPVENAISSDQNDPSLISAWSECIKCLTLLHVVKAMHTTLVGVLEETGLAGPTSSGQIETCNQWQCEDVLHPLAAKLANLVPHVIHTLYQQWWQEDELIMKEEQYLPTVDSKGVGLVLKSGHRLGAALSVLSEVAGEWNGMEPLQHCCAEVVLRLANIHWENLLQITKLVPDQLPPKGWYVVLNSAICLHSMLTRLQTILDLTPKYAVARSQLLHTLTEFTNTLTHDISSYHTHLCRWSLFHNPESHNWTDTRPYFEGERCSMSIQMWHYHLKGLQHDLWEVGGGEGGGVEGGGAEVMVRILCRVLADSTSALEQRYRHACPSYDRTSQFRADILAILICVASFLPHLSTPSTPSTPHTLTTISANCFSLLHSLAIVSSPLDQLHSSLLHHLSHPPPHTPSHPHTLPPSQSHKWIQHIDLTHFGILATDNQDSNDVLQNFHQFVSLPYPSWYLLVKMLLAKEATLPSFLLHILKHQHQHLHQQEGEEETEDQSVISHLCLTLSHCFCQPQALCRLFQESRGQWTKRAGGAVTKDKCVEWLGHTLKRPLQENALSWAMEEGSWNRPEGPQIEMMAISTATDRILKFLERLECVLGQLPSPVSAVLWELAGVGMETTSQVGGLELARLLVSLSSHWLATTPDFSSLPSDLKLPLSLIHWTLSGARPDSMSPDLAALPPHIPRVLQLQAPHIRQKLQGLGASLSRAVMATNFSSVPRSGVEMVHRIVADNLMSNPGAQESLYYIFQWARKKKDYIMELLQSENKEGFKPCPVPPLTSPRSGFNALEVGVSLGNGFFDHQWLLETPLDWKDMLEFSLPLLTQEKLVKLVGNRFEFQPGAQLQGNEPELTQNIQSLIHHDYHLSP